MFRPMFARPKCHPRVVQICSTVFRARCKKVFRTRVITDASAFGLIVELASGSGGEAGDSDIVKIDLAILCS